MCFIWKQNYLVLDTFFWCNPYFSGTTEETRFMISFAKIKSTYAAIESIYLQDYNPAK